jgi:hypothetical protein
MKTNQAKMNAQLEEMKAWRKEPMDGREATVACLE